MRFRFTRHHLLLLMGFLLHLYNNLAYRFLDSFLPLYATDSEAASQIQVGIIFASFCLAIMIFSPIMGELCKKRGYKQVIIIGLLLESIVLSTLR